MVIVWGKKLTETLLGKVAEFCPICREIRPFQLMEFGTVGHLYFLPLGDPEKLGYMLQCEECGTLLQYTENPYTGLQQDENCGLEDLITTTNPTIREIHAERLALETQLRQSPTFLTSQQRAGLLLEPFVVMELLMAIRYGKKVVPDIHSGLGCAGTFVLSTIVGIINAMFFSFNDVLPAVALTITIVGTAYTILQLIRSGERQVRENVLPRLARALAPLHPAESELRECLKDCKLSGLAIGSRVSPEQLWKALQHTDEPLPPARKRIRAEEIHDEEY